MTETMGPRRGIGPTDSRMNDARAWRRLTRVAVSAALYAFHPLFLDGWDLRARSFGERRAPARSDHWAEILVMELYPGESLMNMSFRAPVESPSNARKYAIAAALGGACLGAMALSARRQSSNAEQRHPAVGKFLEGDGVCLHYVDSGTGDPLLLIHRHAD